MDIIIFAGNFCAYGVWWHNLLLSNKESRSAFLFALLQIVEYIMFTISTVNIDKVVFHDIPSCPLHFFFFDYKGYPHILLYSHK